MGRSGGLEIKEEDREREKNRNKGLGEKRAKTGNKKAN